MAALKYSRQRESIKEFLRSRTDHPTADTVYENLRQIYPNISLGTVYRNLSLLSDIGEIRKLTNFGSADRYDGRVAPHSHFMCTRCNRVIDMQSDSLNGILEQAAAEFIHGKVFDQSDNLRTYAPEELRVFLFSHEPAGVVHKPD